jgi:hypothetical protein
MPRTGPRTGEEVPPERPSDQERRTAEAVPAAPPHPTIDSTGRLQTTWIALTVLLVLLLAFVAFLLWA